MGGTTRLSPVLVLGLGVLMSIGIYLAHYLQKDPLLNRQFRAALQPKAADAVHPRVVEVRTTTALGDPVVPTEATAAPATTTAQWIARGLNVGRCTQRSPLQLGAYYYVWYVTDAKWREGAPPTHPFAFIEHPTLGYYNSSDPDVIRQHARWAAAAGVDFFIVGWYPAIHRSLEMYVSTPGSHPVAVHLETMLIFGWQPGDSVDFDRPKPSPFSGKDEPFGVIFVEHVVRLMANLIAPNRDKFVFVDGRPVFVVYVARICVNHLPYIRKLRAAFKQRFGIDPYLVGDVVWETTPATTMAHLVHLVEPWDSITSYNLFEGLSTEKADGYVDRIGRLFQLYRRLNFDLAEQNGVSRGRTMAVVPYVQPHPSENGGVNGYVQPGYDDHLLRGEALHPPGHPRPVYLRDDGRMYAATWRIAAELLASNRCSDPTLVFLTTFNEWYEGTAIEPTKTWGTKYLEATAELKRTVASFVAASASAADHRNNTPAAAG